MLAVNHHEIPLFSVNQQLCRVCVLNRISAEFVGHFSSVCMLLLRAEASQNVSEGAEWAKHRKWHVDVDFLLGFAMQ